MSGSLRICFCRSVWRSRIMSGSLFLGHLENRISAGLPQDGYGEWV